MSPICSRNILIITFQSCSMGKWANLSRLIFGEITGAKQGCHRQQQKSAHGKEKNNSKLGRSKGGHFIGE
jgi:hypothetical protein